jgi:hypothetical protein
MQQALEALEAVYMPYHQVVIALRERLAEPEADELLNIAEALRQIGLTLVRTCNGFRVMNLGQIEANGAAQQQEPVAWRYALDASVEGQRWIYIDKDPHQWLQEPAMVNAAIEELHTSPQPSKPWVGLTDEDISIIWRDIDGSEGMLMRFARAIETKLREKNT